MKQDFNTFVRELQKGQTEEDIKNVYARHFNIKYDTSARHDLYTPQILFEFKYDRNLESLKGRAAVLAQNLYYVHRLKYGITDKPIPQNLCMADKNEAFFTETTLWKDFYVSDQYDWDLAPSNPDPRLIKDIAETESLRNIHVFQVQQEAEYQIFSEKLRAYFDTELSTLGNDKKIITEDNFESVFEYWNGIFGDSVRNGLKTSRYFVCDIQQGRSVPMKESGQVLFQFPSGDAKVKKIFWKDYEYFWSIYEKVTNPDIIRGIIAKIDRLTDDTMRRFHGEFFTPVKFAKKALDYIEATVGKEWWKSGNYRLWDMACGTGNLEYHLHTDALPHCYLSTLYKEDVEHIERLFPSAACFQYDYLNDDVANIYGGGLFQNWKLPKNLLADLANPNLKWIILINPPFATSQTAGTSSDSKKDVSDTQIRKVMHSQNLGEVSRELTMQFLFRIYQEFQNKIAHLGMFYKIKYINSNNDQKFRDNFFHYQFEKGFMFSSAAFSGTSKSSPFPVGFLIWNLSENIKIEDQSIVLDVFDLEVEKISTKKVASESRKTHLSKWIKRPKATIKFPPFSGGITVKSKSKDARDRISEGFLASLMCKGNDFQNQNFTAILSGPYVSAGALSVTTHNFEQAMVVHAVRRIPKADWLNDRDQFLQPNQALPAEFVDDCTVWNLFSTSNQTVSMRNVLYVGKSYEVVNHFFPFLKTDLKTWTIADPDILLTLSVGDDRFIANWLIDRNLSDEATAVLAAAKAIYQYYFAHLNQIRTQKFKIETWDTGWWQIRNALQEQDLAKELIETLKATHNALKQKIRPQIDVFGFLG